MPQALACGFLLDIYNIVIFTYFKEVNYKYKCVLLCNMVAGDKVPKGIDPEFDYEQHYMDSQPSPDAAKPAAEEIPSVAIIDPSGQGKENYVGPVGAKEYIGPVPQIAKMKILESLGAIGGAIKIIGSNLYLSLENRIISQKAMKNIMRIEEGVEGKMIEEKELKPEFEPPKTLEEANILAMRYYLRGIGMKDALEQFLQYIKFNEYLNPVAVVPRDKFIEIVNGDNANLYNILKNTDITDKISENVVIDNSRLKTGGSEFSNRYIEENLKYYTGDFESAENKSFSIPNYTALSILVPDALRVKFVKFAQVNESSRELPLVSIVENRLFRDDHMKKENLVPTDAELSEFVYASGEKVITDLLDFLHGLDEEFSQISVSLRHEPALVNKRLKEAVYRNILQKNNPGLCYAGDNSQDRRIWKGLM